MRRRSISVNAAADISRIRQEIRDVVDCPHLAEDAALVATELATNALLHGGPGGECSLDVERGRSITITMTDGCALPPTVTKAETCDESGRGLLIVQSLASAWGCDVAERGKRTWATVAAHSPTAELTELTGLTDLGALEEELLTPPVPPEEPDQRAAPPAPLAMTRTLPAAAL
ncbi:ATP-binding protein [Streptomyces sp. NPDC005438]|uniref:ATP-binding protein n=1 Tax=Streptomyces sp. NPDC005438 TaxID=3156880 RepID=UPI0033B2BE62